MSNEKMTLEEYLTSRMEFFDFVVASAECCKRRFPDEPYSSILKNRTLLSELLQYTPSAPEITCFLEESDSCLTGAAERFRPLFRDLIETSYPDFLRPDLKYAPGSSFRGDVPHPILPQNWCRFHFRNALCPRSFLDDSVYVADGLLQEIDDAVKINPAYDTLTVFSWLNSLPAFLRFFPPEYQESLDAPNLDICGDLGFLGQFINAAGWLNRKTADFFLKKGVLPYQPRRGHCSFNILRQYLKINF